MSSLGSQQTPNYQFTQTSPVKDMSLGFTTVHGSFQGFASATTNYLPNESRGIAFTVTWVATGQYRVHLPFSLNAYAYPGGAATTGGAPGQASPGMLAEPTVMAISESYQSVPTIGQVVASRLDTVNSATLNTFDIFTYSSPGTAADLTTADRVQFNIGFKQLNSWAP